MNAESNTTAARPKRRRSKWFLILIFLIGAGVVGYFKVQGLVAKEQAAASRLQQLGALCSNSTSLVAKQMGKGRHPGAANLLTIQDPAKFREAVELLRDLPFLTSIDMSGTSLKDEDLSLIAGLKRITNLNLSQTQVTDKGIAHLKGMSGLRNLHAGGTPVTKESLPVISRLKGLQVVDLSGTNIDGGLGPLAALPELEWLLLRDLKIEDDSLGELSSSPKLNRLDVRGATLADESGLKKLADKGGRLKIETD